MARTFNAGLTTVLEDGGSLWWCVIVDGKAFSNIRAESSFTPTVQTGRLLDISAIDISGNILQPLAKISDVTFTLQNMDDTIDPLTYIGQETTINIGYGETMTDTSYETVFTGKIYKPTVANRIITFTIRGRSQLWDKDIGKSIGQEAHKKYRGKIYPITHGDWTDDDAYAPMFINKPLEKFPSLITGERKMKQLDNIYIYDTVNRVGYRTLKQDDDGVTQWFLNTDNNTIDFMTTDNTLIADMWNNDTTIKLTKTLVYESIVNENNPARIILKIDDEIIEVLRDKPFSNFDYKVDRGLFGTAPAFHTSEATVYQQNAENSLYTMKCQHIFYATGITGFEKVINSYTGQYVTIVQESDLTSRENILEHDGQARLLTGYSILHENTVATDRDDAFGFVFQPPSVEANVVFSSWILAASIETDLKNTIDTAEVMVSQLFLYVDTNEQSSIVAPVNFSTPYRKTTFDNTAGVNDKVFPTGFTANGKLSDLFSSKLYGKVHMELDFEQTSPAIKELCYYQFLLNRIGIRADFLVSPIRYDPYWKGKGRENPGGYFNGSSGDLLENPSSIIEDFCRNDVLGMSSTNLNNDSFDDFYTDKTNYKLATAIYTKTTKQPNFRDILAFYLRNANGMAYENYASEISLVSWDSVTPTRTLDNSEIQVDGKKFSDVKWSYTETSKVITSIEIRYKPILPLSNEYAGVIYCKRSEDPEPVDVCNFANVEGGIYSGYLQTGYDTTGEERPLNITLDGVRDSATAELIAKQLIEMLYKPLVLIDANCTYKAMDIEFGDKIYTDIDVLPSVINGKTWMVIGQRITPNIRKDPSIKLKLMELGTATIDDPTEIQDTYATGDAIQDTYATGDTIQEVF